MVFEPKIVLDQTISFVPRTNVVWTYVSGKVLPRAYSDYCSIGNKHLKISQNRLHLFVRVKSNSRKCFENSGKDYRGLSSVTETS